MQDRFFITNQSGLKLSTVIDRDDSKDKQGIVIIAGGFGTYKDSNKQKELAVLFSELGYAVMRLDFRGRGESEGSTLHSTVAAGLEDLSAAVDYIKAQAWVDQGNIVLYGNSYGGGISNFEAARNHIYKFLILTSPCVDNAEMYEFCGKVDFDAWRKNRIINLFGAERDYALYEDGKNVKPYEASPNITCPTLIIHGDQDEAVPYSQSKKIHRLIKNSELIILKGYDHRYTQGFDLIKSTIKEWLESKI